MNLDDLRHMRALDTQNFLHDVDALPDQMAQARGLAQSYTLPDGFSHVQHIVITGMGGSAIGGSLVQAYVAGECGVPITAVRDYSLPAAAGPETLVIASSHSGNTERPVSTPTQSKPAAPRPWRTCSPACTSATTRRSTWRFATASTRARYRRSII